MKWWWQLKRSETELERELRADLQLEEEEQLENGLSPEEARYAAQRAFGNTLLIKEQTLEVWGWLWLDGFIDDVRYAARGLLRSPAFTSVSVLSLALGLGLVTGIFGALNAVFLDAVSARNPSGLRYVYPGDGDVSYSYFQYLSSAKEAKDPLVAGIAAYSRERFGLRSENEVESIAGDIVSSNFFDILGIEPALGRNFLSSDQQGDQESHVVIISNTFWKSRLHGAPDVLGRTIELNREPFAIIGILPSGYRSIHGYGMSPDLYVPLTRQIVGGLGDPDAGNLQLVARVLPNVTAAQLKASLLSIVQVWRQRYPDNKRYASGIDTYPVTGIDRLQRDGVPIEVTVFVALVTVVGIMVLLIACANVAGLLVARGVARTRDTVVRIALGAPRRRLVQQLLIESGLLAAMGGCSAILMYLGIAAALGRLQVRAAVPFELHLHVSLALLYLTAALVAVTALISGLVPALQLTRGKWQLGSNQIGERGPGATLLRRALVAGQFALSFLLLVSAALFLRGLAMTSHVDPGFDVQHVITAEVTLDQAAYPPDKSEQFFGRAISDLMRQPGVLSASAAAIVPLGIEHWVMSVKAGDQMVQRVFMNGVTPGYFRTMQIPIEHGRDFQTSDGANGAQVAIVNETFARQYLHNDGLDQLVYIPVPGVRPTFSEVKIVGIVGDSKYGSLGEVPMPALYWPASQTFRNLTLMVRTSSTSGAAISSIRSSLAVLDPRAAVKIELMQERLAGALLPSKVASTLLGCMGSLGLLLAAVGIYGVMAYIVGLRTAEIGVRLALGDTRQHVLLLVLKDAAWQLCTGVVSGSIVAVLVTQPLIEVLPAGMKALDPLSFGTVGVLLMGVGLVAATIPAWRASRIDPMQALRSE
jgi:predicted permease